MRTLTLAGAALAILAPPAAAFDARTVPSPNYNRLGVDVLAIQGLGSTGNVSEMTVVPSAEAQSGRLARIVADQAAGIAAAARRDANLSDLTSAAAARSNIGLGTAATYGAADLPVSTATQTAIATRLAAGSNLSELTSPSAARTNLGLGGAAVLGVGTTTGTVAAGNDARFVTVDGNSGGTLTSALTLPSITLSGAGSTGDVSAMSVVPSSAAPFGKLARIVSDQAAGIAAAARRDANLADLTSAAAARNNLGLAASATTDTTNADNISSGTLAGARLPLPTSAVPGGVKAATAPSNSFGTGIGTDGLPTFARPTFSDLAGTATLAQGGTGASTAPAARTNLGLGTAATYATADLPVSTATQAGLDGKADRGRTVVGDADYAVLATDRLVAITSLTVSRVLTLPSSGAYPEGQALRIVDETGALNSDRTVTIQAAAGETIAGQASVTIASPYQSLTLISNHNNLWTY